MSVSYTHLDVYKRQHLRKEEMEADKAPLFHTPAPVLPVPYETEEEENGKTRTKTKYKVLVVEDDEDIRRYICRELASDYHTPVSYTHLFGATDDVK